MQKIFESDRLYFRYWENEDRPIFAEMNADPVCMKFFPKLLNEDESNSLIDKIEKHLAEKGYGLWAVEEKASNHFIGFIGLNYTEMQTEFSPCVEIGWRLHKDVWGKGYTTEGARACLQYAYDNLNFDEIYSFTSKLNIRSERVMQKIGMKKVGEFYHPKIDRQNILCAHVLYRIMKGEYKRL